MYCRNCGTEMNEQDTFCATCGLKNDGQGLTQPIAHEQSTQQAYDVMYRMFKYERLAWKIVGIVYTAMGGVYALLSVLYLLLGVVLSMDEAYAGGVTFVYGVMFFAFALTFASVGVFGLVMIKRAQRYMEEMTTDIRPAIVRATSVGMIVLGALFNTIAMVFIIINFAFAKANQSALQQIVQEQNLNSFNEK